MSKFEFILASKSPRRKELIGWTGIPFIVRTSEVEEVSNASIPDEIVREIASLKGRAILNSIKDDEFENPLVVAADTIVCLGDVIYGKPKDRGDAKRILSELAGKTHTVITAVYMAKKDQPERVFSCHSQVQFTQISDELLDHYLDMGESYDKAGAYGIQGPGLLFIGNISGSYSNVVGFPLSDFINELKDYLQISHDNWKQVFIER